MTDLNPTEADTTENEKIIEKPKKSGRSQRSPEQLAVLENARKKALEVRKQNAEMRKKEKAILKEQKDKELADRRAMIDNYEKKKIASTNKKPEEGEEEEPEEIIEYRPKPKPKPQPTRFAPKPTPSTLDREAKKQSLMNQLFSLQ